MIVACNVDSNTALPYSAKPNLTIDDLCIVSADYLNLDQVNDIRRAHFFAKEAHEGQIRHSGDPYIDHPLAVAHVLANMRMDHECIISGLLHDVIEDTNISRETLVSEFGEEVALLVDGVSKLAKAEFETRQQAQAENLRKMMLAMTQDIRVIIVKLADRLHNMRTLGHLSLAKQRRIASETIDIYAPIAQRLGMNLIRCELEELGFRILRPVRYRVLAGAIRKARGNRREIVDQIITSITDRMDQDGLTGDVQGREKNVYSLHQKMVSKQLPFSEVMDVYAFRIVVDDVNACYRMLGIIHNLYKPVQGKLKDYIAIPKVNGYQALHTVLFTPYGMPIEVQIRSQAMDQLAEAGVAAHWLYKTGEHSGSNQSHRLARQWLKSILEIQKGSGDSVEFLENLRIDLFPDEIYVFTPKGEIMSLPRGATAIDFAYAVHSDVGNTCVGVKVGHRFVPLSTRLESGQSVDIITSQNGHPNPAWLNYATTAKARSGIRHYLKQLRSEDAILLGRQMLSKHLSTFSLKLDDISKKQMAAVVNGFDLVSLDALLIEIGLGNRPVLSVIQKLLVDYSAIEKGEKQPLIITGTEGMVVSFGRCCYPIPGDPIHGFISAGRGIVVHQMNCKTMLSLCDQSEKWLDVMWAADIQREFSVEIVIHTKNQRGALATIATVISESGSNIDNVMIDERDGGYHYLRLTLEVLDRQHLARVMRRLRRIKWVGRIVRP